MTILPVRAAGRAGVVIAFATILALTPPHAADAQPGHCSLQVLFGTEPDGSVAPEQMEQGASSAISADGTTLVVSAPNRHVYDPYINLGGLGALYVFTRAANGTWVQLGNELTGAHCHNCVLGASLAISADGSRIASGGWRDDGNRGSVYVFARQPNGTYVQQGAKLVAANDTSALLLGWSVSMSPDGTTIAAGAPGYKVGNVTTGGTFIFTRAQGKWLQAGEPLVGDRDAPVVPPSGLAQGFSVAMTGGGSTVAIGASFVAGGLGGAYIFVNVPGSGWVQQALLTGAGSSGLSGQGTVAFSKDGSTLALAGGGDGNGVGATWAFRNTGGGWAQVGDKMVGFGGSGQGSSLAVSTNGSLILVGAEFSGGSGPNSGSAWLFSVQDGQYGQLGSRLYSTSNQYAWLGASVSLAGDGSVAVVGAPGIGSGSTLVYTARSACPALYTVVHPDSQALLSSVIPAGVAPNPAYVYSNLPYVYDGCSYVRDYANHLTGHPVGFGLDPLLCQYTGVKTIPVGIGAITFYVNAGLNGLVSLNITQLCTIFRNRYNLTWDQLDPSLDPLPVIAIIQPLHWHGTELLRTYLEKQCGPNVWHGNSQNFVVQVIPGTLSAIDLVSTTAGAIGYEMCGRGNANARAVSLVNSAGVTMTCEAAPYLQKGKAAFPLAFYVYAYAVANMTAGVAGPPTNPDQAEVQAQGVVAKRALLYILGAAVQKTFPIYVFFPLDKATRTTACKQVNAIITQPPTAATTCPLP